MFLCSNSLVLFFTGQPLICDFICKMQYKYFSVSCLVRVCYICEKFHKHDKVCTVIMNCLCNSRFNTLRLRKNGRRLADDIFKHIFLNENVRISIKISLKFVPKGPINNKPALVQIMAWRRTGNKPLSGPMMVSLLTHICVTRPQWVNDYIHCNVWNEITHHVEVWKWLSYFIPHVITGYVITNPCWY